MKRILFLCILVIRFSFLYSQIISKVDVNKAIDEETVAVTHTDFDIGSITDVFDNSSGSLARTANINPVVITLEFDNAISLIKSKIMMIGGEGTWTLEAADLLTDMDNQINSYALIFADRTTQSEVYDSVSFPVVTKKLLRLTAYRTTGDDYVHLNDWQIFIQADVDSIYFPNASDIDTVLVAQNEQALIMAYDSVMKISIELDNSLCDWSSTYINIANVSNTGMITGINPGVTEVEAYYPGSSVSATLPVEVTEDVNAPDLTVCYIKRLPEMDYIENSTSPQIEGWPSAGQNITWRAYVKNFSPDTVRSVNYTWKLNGSEIDEAQISEILPYSLAYADLEYEWDFNHNELAFTIDSENSLSEVNETNNELSIFTHAISLHFYVEESLYKYFRRYQSNLNAGSNCWEDWAQILQVKRWNNMFADATFPELPLGVTDRIRVDSIAVVPDGALPMHGGVPSNNPNTEDKTVDLQWGFSSTLLNGDFYANTTANDEGNAFFWEGSLLHELGHARYLIDNYGFDVSAGDTLIAIMEDGERVAGSYYMPFIAWDAVHYNDFPGIMGGSGIFIDPYNAFCLSNIEGHRAVCGNMNAPCNIGIFLNDLPAENILILKDQYGNLLKNTSLKLYQASSQASWYGKYYDDIPDLSFVTDTNGMVEVGKCPFSNTGNITHTYGLGNGVLILRAESAGKVGYAFLESTQFNMKYWLGDTLLAHYPVSFNMFGTPMDVKITDPGHGHHMNRLDTLNISCSSTLPNIKKIDFFVDDILIGTDTTADYSYSWIPGDIQVGRHILRAKLTDTDINAVCDQLVFYTMDNRDDLLLQPEKPAGEEDLCMNPPDQIYTTNSIPGMNSYAWILKPESAGTITGTDTMAVVDFDYNFFGLAKICVAGQNIYGNSLPSDTLFVHFSICDNIDEVPISQSVHTYPNPVSDELNVEFEDNTRSLHVIKIMDLSGQTIRTIETNNNTEKIDMHGLKGIYLIQISDASFVYINKIIVL